MTEDSSKPVEGRSSYTFLHLSDIHFGQEKGGEVFQNKVIKNDLVRFLGVVAAKRRKEGLLPLDGILVTGDIAFGGKKQEYREAADWLAQIAEKIGCPVEAVRVVPGNHDVDWSLITALDHLMIDTIIEKGQKALDAFVATENDRERLYARFKEYVAFAAGYGCILDDGGGAAGTRDYEFFNGLKLRFLGLNSALVCRGKEEDKVPGKLFLGTKQRVIDREDGVEYVVLIHHPMNWLADQAESWGFLKTRARVFISGHEHKPNLQVESVDGNSRVLRIDSGAIVPPEETDGYGYTFNIIDFAVDTDGKHLHVSVDGYLWDIETTSFKEDADRFNGGHQKTEVLHCPMFAAQTGGEELVWAGKPAPVRPSDRAAKAEEEAVSAPSQASDAIPASAHRLAELRLRFFHGLTAVQRLQVLVRLEILPTAFDGQLTANFELGALSALAGMGRLDQLEAEINRFGGGVENGTGE